MRTHPSTLRTPLARIATHRPTVDHGSLGCWLLFATVVLGSLLQQAIPA